MSGGTSGSFAPNPEFIIIKPYCQEFKITSLSTSIKTYDRELDKETNITLWFNLNDNSELNEIMELYRKDIKINGEIDIYSVNCIFKKCLITEISSYDYDDKVEVKIEMSIGMYEETNDIPPEITALLRDQRINKILN